MYGIRVGCVAILPIAAVLSLPQSSSVFVSRSLALFGAIISSQPTFGLAMQYLSQYLKAACIWVPISTAAAALELHNNPVAWSFVYFFGLFLIGVFYDGMARKMCQLLFNTCMIAQAQNPGIVYPSRVFVDYTIGTLFGICVSLVPYPLLSRDKALTALRSVAADTATCFMGLGDSFWTTSQLQRNVHLMRLRSIRQDIVRNMAAFAKTNGESVFEPLLDSSEQRQVRDAQRRLFEDLVPILDMQHRVIEMIAERPHVIEESERAKSFGRKLMPVVKNAAEVVDVVLFQISRASTTAELRGLGGALAAVTKASHEVQHMYMVARLQYFYRWTPEQSEEYVPLMATFIFSVTQFCRVVQDFLETATTVPASVPVGATPPPPPFVKGLLEVTVAFFLEPVKESVEGFRRLVFDRSEQEVMLMVESLKVSSSMLLSVGFFFLLDSNTALLTGPTIIAFVASSTHSEAVQGSVVRLVGTLLGSVFGFFAATLAAIPRDRVAALCTVLSALCFFRQQPTIGLGAVYACFTAVAQISVVIVSQDASNTINRIQQTTFAVLIYVAISVFVMPARPRDMLVRKRADILISLSNAVRAIMALFDVPITAAVGSPSAKLEKQLLAQAQDAVKSLRQQLQVEAALIPLAENEPTLQSVPFPGRANADIHTIHKNMAATLQMLIRAWTFIRLGRHREPSKEILSMVKYLSPIAHDISNSFQTYADVLMQEVTRYGRVGLADEVMRRSVEISTMVKELHLRKGQIFVKFVRQSVTVGPGDSETPSEVESPSLDSAQRPHPVDETALFQAAVNEDGPQLSFMSREALADATLHSAPFGNESADHRAALPANFQMPISREDSEGFHALTLSLVLFAAECRSLIVHVQDVNRHWCQS